MAENQPPARPILALGAASTLVVAFVGAVWLLCTESRPADLGECPEGCEDEMRLALTPATSPDPTAIVVRLTVTNCTIHDHDWDKEWAATLKWNVWQDNVKVPFVVTRRVQSAPSSPDPAESRSAVVRRGRFISHDVAINQSVRTFETRYRLIGEGPDALLPVDFEVIGRFDIGNWDGPIDIQVEYHHVEYRGGPLGERHVVPEKMWRGASRSNKLRLHTSSAH